MGAKSKIEWTDATWSPIRARRKDTGKVGVHCERVSPGCKNCYSATFNHRGLPVHGTGLDFTVPNRDLVDIFLDEEMLMQPLRWRKPKKIFVCSQTDLFAEFVPYEMIDRVFGMMAMCPQHTFQVLTKRPKRMCEIIGFSSRMVEVLNIGTGNVMSASWIPPLENVWLGVSAEDQQRADERIPLLLLTPAAKRFVSYEPALGPVDFGRCYRVHGGDGLCDHEETGLDWVIAGGESGSGARPARPQWFRDVRDQCLAAAVPFFFKQWGEWAPHINLSEMTEGMRRVGKHASGRLLDGHGWNQFPEVTRG